MTKETTRLRRAGHDQIVIALACLLENLIDHYAVPNTHIGGDAKAFELSLLPAQICSEFRFRFEQAVNVLFELHEVCINCRGLGHDMQQRHGGPHCGCQSACEFYRSLDEFLSARANKK